MGTNFGFEKVLWASKMKDAKPAWSFSLDTSALTTPVALTWVDRFGNEVREVVEPSAWPVRKK